MIMIMKGSASHRFTAVQQKNALTSLRSQRTVTPVSRSIHWVSRPNSPLNMPVFHSRMLTYPGMAQGNMRMVLYTFLSGRRRMLRRFAIRKAMVSCKVMFTAVHTTVSMSAERNPESNTVSARA